MKKLTDINWDLLKFQHEVLGVPLAVIQEDYEISEAVLRYQARDWKHLPANQKPLEFTKLEDITALNTEIADQVKNEVELVSLIKQKFLFPKYVELEAVLLNKAISLANSLATDETASAGVLKNLTMILAELLRNNPILAAQQVEEPAPTLQEVRFNVVDSRCGDTKKTDPHGIPEKKV